MAKMVSIFIESVDGDTRQTTKLSLEDATELERILAIQSVFNVLGVNTTISDMLDDYVKIGKAYDAVTTAKQTPDPLEKPSAQPLPLKYDKGEYADIAESKDLTQYATNSSSDVQEEGVTAVALAFAKTMKTTAVTATNQDEPVATDIVGATKISSENETNNVPPFYETGIKHTPTGNRYQCRIHCGQCGLKRTLYIKPTDRLVHCHDCHKQYKVRPAKKSGYLIKDANKNFFIAGTVIGEDERFNANT